MLQKIGFEKKSGTIYPTEHIGWSTPVRNFQKSGRILIFLSTLIYAKNLVNWLMFEVA
jgi:hypothetical protein